MDDFVKDKLTEWDLSDLIDRFRDEEIDQESLYCLEDQDINNLIPKTGPRSRFRKKLMLLKTSDSEQQEKSDAVYLEGQQTSQVLPSTSKTCNKAKRKMDPVSEPRELQPPPKLLRNTESQIDLDEGIYGEVEKIMKSVKDKLKDNGKLSVFLKDKIDNLKTKKKEQVGLFGRTGAGKSSLINAVIEEKNLLPSGEITACTSVIIKVETDAKLLSQEYEADIEFINKKDWKDEVWFMLELHKENSGSDTDKLSAVYEEEWKHKSADELMYYKYFSEIPEFVQNKKKTLSGHSHHDLSDKLKKYTKAKKEVGVKRLYWPLVKCVTIRLPENPHLQHVTLVDLPGTGDRNKSRDQMWKEIIGKCSVVWIVTEINRPIAEREPWEMLEDACSLMGNGGQCQKIYFICTKSDTIKHPKTSSTKEIRDLILKRNAEAKSEIRKEFQKLPSVMKHFSADCFEVFTVSSDEFMEKNHLSPQETEITRLQETLKDLNDSETLNYISGAHGILSLIEGARCSAETAEKNDVYKNIEKNMEGQLLKIQKTMEEACKAFEKCLEKGVEESKSSCEKDLQKLLNPRDGRGFHRTLRALVENGGIHKPRGKREINLNVKITSHLTDSINEQFRKTFPNEAKHGAFNGVISNFSLNTEKLIEKYQDVELQLLFLQTEEAKINSKLSEFVRDEKKKIYNSLVETIMEYMDQGYKEAATITGDGALSFMGEKILQHVTASKDTMFEKATEKMMALMRGLETDVLETLSRNMQHSIAVSLKEDGNSLPDVSAEYEEMKNCKQLMEETP